MEVALDPVSEDDKSILANLMQLYCYDLSDVRGYGPDPHGRFVYRFLDHYFLDDNREAFFIRQGESLGGFAMRRLRDDGWHEVAEFFVMKTLRRNGLGTLAAELLIREQPGKWEISFDVANQPAVAFWPRVADRLASGSIERIESGPPERTYRQTALRFTIDT